MKRKLLGIILVSALAIGAFVVPTAAATSANITVTATGAFVSISIAQSTWTVNGITGTGFMLPNTVYYANPLGDTTAPASTVASGSCYFTMANTSNVATDITVNFPNFASGDAMTNINTGYANNGANAFGASGYIVGMTWPGGAVTLQATGSALLKSNLAASTALVFGIAIKTQTGAWTSATAETSTVVCTAVVH